MHERTAENDVTLIIQETFGNHSEYIVYTNDLYKVFQTPVQGLGLIAWPIIV